MGEFQMKSIKNITLLAMLMVLGACSVSADERAFFNNVKGKNVYLVENNQLIGTFSFNGDTFTEKSPSGEIDIFFTELLSVNKAVYSIPKIDTGYTFEIDGTTGTAFTTIYGVPSIKAPIWLQ